MDLALKHTMRQGGRLPGSVGSGGSVHGPLPDWLTPMARGGAESTGASDWPPLSVRNLHHRDANPSRCGTAPRARLAASILEIERTARVALQKNGCVHCKTLYPGRYAHYLTEMTTEVRFSLPHLCNLHTPEHLQVVT